MTGAELDRTWSGAFHAALGGARVPGGWAPRLPPPLRESIVAAGCPDRLVSYYAGEMPRLFAEQLFRRGDPAVDLLWRPLDLEKLPRLRSALDGIRRSEAAALLVEGSSVAEMYSRTLFGSGLPMVGAYPGERRLIAEELSAGADPDAVIDLRLSGNLVHEICHGPARDCSGPPPAWGVVEAAALLLGSVACPRHVYPDVPAEAVPGVSLFTLFGEALARLFGRGRLFETVLIQARSLHPALDRAEWQEWRRRGDAPFARDMLRAFDWIKLAAACAEGRASDAPDLLDAAAAVPWRELRWWSDPPDERDDAMVTVGVRALFQANVVAPTYQTHPAELPGGRFVLDVEGCALWAPPRREGVFGEPARWIFPPPLARLLRERGARSVQVEGARRTDSERIAAGLVAMCRGSGPLPAEATWTCSR